MKLLDNLIARSRAGRKHSQRGFTMVELAVVLVVAGLILVAVLKGTDTINKAKAERAVADLRGLQGMIMEYQKRTGRLPGDCNNDGRIGFGPDINIYPAALLDATEANRTLPSPAVVPAAGAVTANCTSAGDTEIVPEVLWNDMRRNNVVDPQRLPRELAKNASGSYYAVGNMVDAAARPNNANIIVVYSIPVWLAEAIDASIDGAVSYTGTGAAPGVTAAANSGRVRRWDVNMAGATPAIPVFTANAGYTNGYALNGETRDSLISISYQFDVNKLPN
jgi:prepilin-type N-terminal cleavage/methylation domain-containing protein